MAVIINELGPRIICGTCNRELKDCCKEYCLKEVKEALFKIGERVRKDSGDYVYIGEVTSVFRKKSGAIRYVVEDDRGLCLIMNQTQLQSVEKGT